MKYTENPTNAPRSTAEGTEGDGVGVGEQPSQAITEVELWRESAGLTKKKVRCMDLDFMLRLSGNPLLVVKSLQTHFDSGVYLW